MFRAFRKLRLNFTMEGKTRNYFYYACGEILLIVFGILIALQLNNWNEARKDHKKLQAVLLSVADDLALNQERFSKLAENHELFLAATELLFDAHLKGTVTEEPNKDLMNAFRFAAYFPPLTFSEGAYNELLRNNGLDEVKSPQLKGMLDHYHERVDWLISKYPSAKRLVDSITEDIYLYTIITPGGDSNIMQRDTMENGAEGAGEDSFTIVYDLEAFRADLAMNGKLYDLIDIHKDRIGVLNSLDTLTQELMPVLKSEIDAE